MNFAPISALVIGLFCAYQIFLVLDDVFYLLARQATDPHYDQYHFELWMMGARAFLATVIYSVAAPLGKKVAKNLIESAG